MMELVACFIVLDFIFRVVWVYFWIQLFLVSLKMTHMVEWGWTVTLIPTWVALIVLLVCIMVQ